MEQVATKDFDNNMYYHDTLKTNAKAYLSHLESSVQKAFYLILPELKL